MSTFTVSGASATFADGVTGSDQGTGDLWTLTLSVYFLTPAQWHDLLVLVTTKIAVHVPMGGQAVVDIVNGPGQGTLVCGLGTTTAILTGLKRTPYLSSGRSLGSATFLITGDWG